MNNHVDIYQMVTDKIIEKLEQGHIPWRKDWVGATWPQNLLTKERYHGINFFILPMLSNTKFKSPYYLTYRQALAKHGNVKRGEKGIQVIFWNWIKVKNNAEGEDVEVPFLRYYTVFNLEQCEGIEVPQETFTHTPITECENIINNYKEKPEIRYGGAQAFYREIEDFIQMPPKESFKHPEGYYSTLFHELTHSTGHIDRLGRFKNEEKVSFGDETYSREELVAEMGSAYLCAQAGISNELISNQAAYIQGWLKVLKNNKLLLIQVAGKAQRAVDYITN